MPEADDLGEFVIECYVEDERGNFDFDTLKITISEYY